MNIKIIKICFASLLTFAAFTLAATEENHQIQQQIEMKTYEVDNIHLYEDSDEGAIFTFNDGSKWFRTWWDGPVYYLEVGQTIAVIPMTEAESPLHTLPFYVKPEPYWIILHPKANTSEVGVVYKID